MVLRCWSGKKRPPNPAIRTEDYLSPTEMCIPVGKSKLRSSPVFWADSGPLGTRDSQLLASVFLETRGDLLSPRTPGGVWPPQPLSLCSAPTGRVLTQPDLPRSRPAVTLLLPAPRASGAPLPTGPGPGALLPPCTFHELRGSFNSALSRNSRRGKGRGLTHCRSGTRAATGRQGQSEPGKAMRDDQQAADKRAQQRHRGSRSGILGLSGPGVERRQEDEGVDVQRSRARVDSATSGFV